MAYSDQHSDNHADNQAAQANSHIDLCMSIDRIVDFVEVVIFSRHLWSIAILLVG
jgi:hypothetical protein